MAMAICICNFCNGNGMKVPFARNPGTCTPFQFIGIANAAGLCCFFSCLLQLRYAKALSPVCVGMFPQQQFENPEFYVLCYLEL